MDKLNVCFVSQAGAYLASHRMRVMKPVELLNLCVDNIEAVHRHNAEKGAHVNIFGKHFEPNKTFLAK